MLDIGFIREHEKDVRQNMLNRNLTVEKLDQLMEVDKKRGILIKELDDINRTRNENSEKMKVIRDDSLITQGKELKEKKSVLEKELEIVEKQFYDLLSWIPNMLSNSVPIGKDESENVEIYGWVPNEGILSSKKLGKGEFSAQFMPQFPPHADKNDFVAKNHIELGENADIIDLKQGALVSGSRFVYLKKEAVLLQMALFDLLTGKLLEKGFYPINPPLLLKERALFGTSHFPADKDQVYSIKNDNVEDENQLYLVGSSEPSNFAYFMDKTLPKLELPQKMFATTACFRSEVGSWGRDVKGIKRVHQFDKLEMDVVCLPEQSEDIFNELLDINKWFWEILEIPYHIIFKCSGDSGYYASYKQYDVEAWLPGQKAFIEVGTDTNASDYQSRRLNIKYTGDDGKKYFVHTVNDTGCPSRALIAVIENYQQSDGSIKIPNALQNYMKSDIIKVKKK